MPRADAPSPIPLRTPSRPLPADSQERVALALTLMTKFPLDATAAERAATASAIADVLEALASGAGLTPELRRLCGRLQRLWSDLPARETR